MQTLLTVLLAAHGVAHLPGFLVSWRLREFGEMPYRTTVLGGALDVGAVGIRSLGLLWLVVGIGFVLVAGLIWIRPLGLMRVALPLIGLSLALCVLYWPDARLGVAANVLIAVLVLISGRGAGWWR